jgi:hypothetical protein
MWTDNQLALIQQGGNEKLSKYFDAFSLDDEELRYKTLAAAFYRRRMHAKALELDFPEIQPGYDEGRMLIDGRSIEEVNFINQR